MQLEDIYKVYRQSETIKQIREEMQQSSPVRLYISGLCGSSKAIVAKVCAEMNVGMHFFIFPDKETAAFFYHDMEQLFNEKNLDFSEKRCLFFPSSYRKSYPFEEVESYNVLLRTRVLQKITTLAATVVVSYTEALTEKILPHTLIDKQSMKLYEGEELSMDDIIHFLSDNDFEYSDYVFQPGQFTVRGGIVDVFSFADEYPYRIEFFGDSIKSLRVFNPDTQASKSKISEIVLMPNLAEKQQMAEKIDFFSVLPTHTNLWIDNVAMCTENIAALYKKIHEKYESEKTTIAQLAPEQLYIDESVFLRALAVRRVIAFGNSDLQLQHTKEITFSTSPQITFNQNVEWMMSHWMEHFEKGIQNYFGSENPNQSKRVRNIIHDLLETHADYKLWSGDYKSTIEKKLLTFTDICLHEGFIDKNHNIAFYTDHQVFNRYHRYAVEDKYRRNESVLLKEIYDLQVGDYVTHIDHGIGKYAGLEKIEVNGKLQEAIKIIYKNNDILYISIHSLHRISKYVGKDGTAPTLHRIGSNVWNKVKERTKSRVKELVIDLTKLYAERKSTKGFAFSPDNYLQTELEASFIYEDTPDQLKATNDVKHDMEADFPMDRLICGDVGFGKTEVAIRAAFKAVCDSKQVAVLVPTTVLALQHFNTVRDRLEKFPCKIAYLNRFTSAKMRKEILKELKEGKIDILIGTHRLLGKDVEFKDLGLLIIDEEQKFGVEAKEKLRSFKVSVDTLTMTATPIPRTLQFSLMGARDISIMQTPPLNRYPIQTELHVFSEELIQTAVSQEIFRGGQVFFVHNRIENLYELAALIQQNFPDVKVAVAHGQMDGVLLEKTMIDFIDGLFDVLVCTTIIESGLDIPNANTIIINEAQNYGLSDLHQLRGRVGRKNVKAFCYLLTPPLHTLAENANKRLRAIEEFSDIGSGFNIAMRDLDIRGAGNLLGAEQSGFISDIGYEMYQKILEEAIFELQSQGHSVADAEPEYIRECVIETDLEILIPDTYVSHNGERYYLYKELNDISSENKLKAFEESLDDRFGTIPWQTMELLNSIRLRWLGKDIGFEKLVLKQNKLIAHFISRQESNYFESKQFNRILNYLQMHPGQCFMRENGNKLTLTFPRVSNVENAIRVLHPLVLNEQDVYISPAIK
jgi:transcription-repair coupling factor (superfamily II helicase)